MSRKIFILTSLILLVSAVSAKEIVVYHTSDMHGHYFSREDKQGNQFGGFARLASLLQSTPQKFILLDSGDFSSGSYEANLSGGKYSITLMNKMGYTATTIGNHDSDFGDIGMGKMLEGFKGDILAMNLFNLEIPGKKVKPHEIYNVEGIKIGVIGVAMDGYGLEKMKIVNTFTTQDFEDEISAVKKEGAQVIIVLAHDSMLEQSNISVDKRTKILEPIKHAPSLKDVSLLLGGHAHMQTLIGKLNTPEGLGPWVIESGPYMESVSKVVISQNDKTGEITIHQPEFIRLDGAEDPEIKAYLKSIRVNELDDKLYAHVPKLITKYPAPEQADRAPGVARMMADQMFQKISKFEKVDLTAFSLNSTRSDYNPGNLTGRYFAEMTPYEEHSGTFNIGGEHLLRAMLESIGFRDGKCFSVYGYSKNVHITFSCNDGKPKLEKVTINGKTVNPKKTYRMGMLTHLPRGFYEGKPFQIMPSDAIDDGTIIKHYREITSAAMLFGIIEQARQEQGKDVPEFIAPQDIQVEQISKEQKELEDKLAIEELEIRIGMVFK